MALKAPLQFRILPVASWLGRRPSEAIDDHYHVERNHQGLGNTIPFPSAAPRLFDGPIVRRERLGGLLTFYERKAA